MEKINRIDMGFVKGKGPNHAQCATCPHWLSEMDRCELHSDSVKIDGDDSCIYYLEGKPQKRGKCLGLLTPETSGLVHRRVQCHRCRYFDPVDEPREHCDLYTQLNRMFPKIYELDRYVAGSDCCNFQTEGKRDPSIFGPHGPLGEHGEAMKHAVRVASAARKKMVVES